MKKNFFFALLSAIALTGTAGLSSCSSSEETAEVNPNYDPKTNSVNVELALNISTDNTAKTRMSDAVTQATLDNTFRGISDARLFTFSQTSSGSHVNVASTGTLPTIGKRYDLPQLVESGFIDNDKSRRVLEMSLPVSTNTLVFYGKAPKKDTDKDADYGALETYLENSTKVTSLSDVTFSVKRRIADKLENLQKVENILAGILSCIMNVNLSNVNEDISAASTAGNNPYVFDVTADEKLKGIKWEDYAKNGKSPYDSNKDQAALEIQLANAYVQMTTIYGTSPNQELRCASGHAILNTITGLWTIVNKVRCAKPYSKEEAVAKRLAVAINEELKKYFEATVPAGGEEEVTEVSGVNFLALSDIITNYLASVYWPGNDGLPSLYQRNAQDYYESLSVELATFPTNYDLPCGAAHVLFPYKDANNITHKIFYFPVEFNSGGVGGGSFQVTNYYYPPELLYFGNSPIRTSSNEHKVSDYPTGTNNWHNSTNWGATDWTGEEVISSTRSVAMKYDINYGTALLSTNVKFDNVTELRDNNHQVQKYYHPEIIDNQTAGEYTDEPDQKLSLASDVSLKLTGVLVGGQSKSVGWDFLPKAVGSEPAFEYGYITDTAIPDESSTVSKEGFTKPNYTLVFDNYNTSTQEAIYVALEFKNLGKPFYGNYNLIPTGGHFYLVGLLDPNNNAYSSAISNLYWPQYHALPPYPYDPTKADGERKSTPRVFMQDYVTKVNFVIGANSLKSAYLTVPDLRSSSLTLGLSVDIQWKTGIDFNDVVLGN